MDPVPINSRWGPGNPGDFSHGSWHILCHLAGGAGVLRTSNGLCYCAITHNSDDDSYSATITHRSNGQTRTVPIDSPEGSQLVSSGRIVAFVEGTSNGHIAARGVTDPPTAFNGWPRQMFDQDVESDADGGTVWEHWCTTRDIRGSSRHGSAMVDGYLSLIAVLGGRFVAAVARGRRQHQHPIQLAALAQAGVLTADEATWDTTPIAIPRSAQQLFYEARPDDSLTACEQLDCPNSKLTYHMFTRRIDEWSIARDVRVDLSL